MRKSDYENYDYREFWMGSKRIYEDSSERLALKKLFKSIKFRRGTIVDLGCGYGRLFNEYRDFNNVIFVDGSINNLRNAKERVSNFLKHDKKRLKNILFVAADISRLPFKDSIVDIALTVRVIHHITQLKDYFCEVNRIMQGDGIFLLEFANKRNLKNILRFFTGRIKKSPFSMEPFHVGKTILNYHPAEVKNILKDAGFDILKQISVSNLRLGFLKKHIKTKVLLFFENLFQNFFSWTETGPSIFLMASCNKLKGIKNTLGDMRTITDTGYRDLPIIENIFICPLCRSKNLGFKKKDRIICCDCNREFDIIGGIYDFRI